MNSEKWITVKGYDGLYEVSNFGRVRSVSRVDSYGRHRKEKVLTPHDNKGYMQVGLYKNGKMSWHFVHRLVAEAFIGIRPNGYEVNHIDEDKANNCANNLEYVTRTENVRHGTGNKRRSTSNINHPALSRPVRQTSKDGEIVAIYPSQAEAHRTTGINASHISLCCLGKRKTAGGYGWCYV